MTVSGSAVRGCVLDATAELRSAAAQVPVGPAVADRMVAVFGSVTTAITARLGGSARPELAGKRAADVGVPELVTGVGQPPGQDPGARQQLARRLAEHEP